MIGNSGDRSSKIILAADDEPENRLLLKSLIEGAGYSFLDAANGTDCLNLALRARPRLVLLDVQMAPGIDGFTTCQKLRSFAELRHTPVLFLTGRKSSEDVKRCVQSGGNDFVVKPFDPVKLLERVNYWASHRVA